MSDPRKSADWRVALATHLKMTTAANPWLARERKGRSTTPTKPRDNPPSATMKIIPFSILALLLTAAASAAEKTTPANAGRGRSPNVGPGASLTSGNTESQRQADPALANKARALASELNRGPRSVDDIGRLDKEIAALRSAGAPAEILVDLHLDFVEFLNREIQRRREVLKADHVIGGPGQKERNLLVAEYNRVTGIRNSALTMARFQILTRLTPADAATINAIIDRHDLKDDKWKQQLKEVAASDRRSAR